MRIIEGMKWMAASFVLLTIVTIIPGVVGVAGAGEHDWLDAMMQAVVDTAVRRRASPRDLQPRDDGE